MKLKKISLTLQSGSKLTDVLSDINRPRSIYQYSDMAPRLSGQTSILGVVFFVFESLLGIERQKKLTHVQYTRTVTIR